MPCSSCGDERKVLKLGAHIVLLPLSRAMPLYHEIRTSASSEITWAIYCMRAAPSRSPFFFERPDYERARRLFLGGAIVVRCPDCTSAFVQESA